MNGFGVGLYPNMSMDDLLGLARQADRSGFRTAWIPDSHLLWREAYVAMGAIAARTEAIRIGTAVTNPLTRRLSVTAGAVSTLAELSGDRAVLGISVGDSALRTEGTKPATVDRLEHDIATLRGLLAGRPVEIVAGSPLRLPHARTAPIYVAATGPRMLDLAGRVADGVILMNGVAPELISAAIERVHAAARSAGRDPHDVAVVVWAACGISETDPERARAAVKYNVARAILRDVPGMDTGRLAPLIARVRAAYDYREHGSSAAAFGAQVPDDLVPEFAFAGTGADVAAQIDALEALPVDEIAFALPDATGDLAPRTVMEHLAALLRRTLPTPAGG